MSKHIIREVFTALPLWDYIFIEPDKELEVTKGGIIIPETAQQKANKGTVVAVGPGKVIIVDGKKIPEPLTLQLGDRIGYSKYSGTEIDIDNGIQYLMLRETDAQCLVKDNYEFEFLTREQQLAAPQETERGTAINKQYRAVLDTDGKGYSLEDINTGEVVYGESLFFDFDACLMAVKAGAEQIEKIKAELKPNQRITGAMIKEEREKKYANVYKEECCIFQYCPNPEICKASGCVSAADAKDV